MFRSSQPQLRHGQVRMLKGEGCGAENGSEGVHQPQGQRGPPVGAQRTATCAREKKIERVCASVRLRVRGQSKCSLRLANVPRLARLVTSRANKSHLITTEC